MLKHVVDENWMYSVLKVVFSLVINTDIDWFFSNCCVSNNECNPDYGSVSSATCKTLIFLKYYCESRDNYGHLVVKIVEIELQCTEWKIQIFKDTVSVVWYIRFLLNLAVSFQVQKNSMAPFK